ncbi:hypothetical protein FOA52_007914 [Chlamydomonas sp. UWO 241]|nr:hypothetical protein FOA52_007914 [Chlamydomonas sp. UWO 241]
MGPVDGHALKAEGGVSKKRKKAARGSSKDAAIAAGAGTLSEVASAAATPGNGKKRKKEKKKKQQLKKKARAGGGGGVQQPGGVNGKLGGVNGKPGGAGGEPGGVNGKPGGVGQKPGGVNGKPGGVVGKPGGVGGKSGGVGGKPGGGSEKGKGKAQPQAAAAPKGAPADKRKRRRDDDVGHLTGVFTPGGELLLRDDAGHVYASARAKDGSLVPVGTWCDQTSSVVPLPEPPADEGEAGAGSSQEGQPPPPSDPHPVPQPLVFTVDQEDDHCETSPEAYTHVAGLLRLTAESMGIEPSALRIYDPYYCNGAVVRHLAALGFLHVYNENEDFYAVLAEGRVPPHDVVVTNPPYSQPHPQRLLAFLASNAKPWLALMPNWVYAKVCDVM